MKVVQVGVTIIAVLLIVYGAVWAIGQYGDGAQQERIAAHNSFIIRETARCKAANMKVQLSMDGGEISCVPKRSR